MRSITDGGRSPMPKEQDENDERRDALRMPPDDEHNRRLVDEVHPPGWKNPTAEERYHLVVVGAGTAGLVSAAIAANLGARVALVERHLMGGDCLNVGCVPSKGVIRAARAWHEAKTAAERFGGPPATGDGDFAAAMERMRRIRAGIAPVDGARRFAEMGIDVFLGHGRFVAGDELEVAGERLRFRKAVIATGARAAAPPIDGLEDVKYRTNETIFSLVERPRRLGVIGAGPIGAEMSQSFARLGTEVHLFDRSDQILGREERDAAVVVQEAIARDGVHLHLGVGIRRVESRGDAKVVVFRHPSGQGDGEEGRVEVDELLVAAGRAPNVEDLGLEAAGVEYDRRGVEVDDRMRTTNRRIFAIGDVASALQFTHLADFQARAVIRNAFFFGRRKASDLVVPWCTYTSPEVAHVGLYEHDASDAGYEVETLTVELEENDRARLDGETDGFLRLHLKKGSDEILGGTLVAEHAGEMIGPLTLAVTHGIGLSRFSETIFPYPTQAEVYRRAGDEYARRKLTGWVERLFALWFRLLK